MSLVTATCFYPSYSSSLIKTVPFTFSSTGILEKKTVQQVIKKHGWNTPKSSRKKFYLTNFQPLTDKNVYFILPLKLKQGTDEVNFLEEVKTFLESIVIRNCEV